MSAMASAGVRHAAGLHRKLVELLGDGAPSYAQVARLVAGPPERINLHTLSAMCAVLECSPDEIIYVPRRHPDHAVEGIGDRPIPIAVALAGDWHGATAWACAMLSDAERHGCSAVVHTGDFGIWPGYRGAAYLSALDQELLERDMWLYTVDGNHEDQDQIAAVPVGADGVRQLGDRIVHLPRGFRWRWHGQTWLACGGAVSIDQDLRTPGRDWWPQEVITDADVSASQSGGPVDVLVCHDAPAEVPELDKWLSTNGLRLPPHIQALADHGREQVRRIVDVVHPKVIVHGHYHHAYRGAYDSLNNPAGKPTRVIGLDRDGTKMGKNLLFVTLPIDTAALEPSS